MTDQPPIDPPQGMPHFERPPDGAQQAHAAAHTPTPTASSSPGRSASGASNPIARRPWVAAAGAAGLVVVAAAAGYGFGRDASPSTTTTDSGASAVVAGGDGQTQGLPGQDQQQVDPGSGTSGQDQYGSTDQDPFSGSDPFSGQGQFQGPDQDDRSGGFGAQPGTVTPGQTQGGPTTGSSGS